jgi:hypothetical protein
MLGIHLVSIDFACLGILADSVESETIAKPWWLAMPTVSPLRLPLPFHPVLRLNQHLHEPEQEQNVHSITPWCQVMAV